MDVWVCLCQEEPPEAVFDSEEKAVNFCREKNLKDSPNWHGNGYWYWEKLTVQ